MTAWAHTQSTTGSGVLTVTATGTHSDADHGWDTITVTAPAAPTVALINNNPTEIARDLCFTSGAGQAAGISCGDLFVVHRMPAYRTMGKDRSLTLEYNSATATGLLLVPVVVTQPSGAETPNSVTVVVQVGTVKDSASFSGPAGGTATQMVLGRGLGGLATGVYAESISVTNVYSSISLSSTTTGQVLVVNRAASPYGRGWAVDGVEQLIVSQVGGNILWVDGDGSARLYGKLNSTTWVAPAAAFRDTIVYSSASHTYTRSLEHGITVVFDTTGRQIQTLNRFGAMTMFAYTTVAGQSRLSTITVPTDSGSLRQYHFFYNSSTAALDSVRDPGARRLKAILTSGQLTSLTDPDNRVTAFEYSGTHLRMTRQVFSRPDLGSAMTFGTVYIYGNNSRVTQVKVPAGLTGADTIKAILFPWDEQGLAASVGATGQSGANYPSDGIATSIDGPIPGTGDQLQVHVNSFGEPTKSVLTGTGAATTITYGDSAHPALITQVTSPTNLVVQTHYNARGNVDTVWQTSPDSISGLPNRRSTWAYTDPTAPDEPTATSNVLGRQATYTYTAQGAVSLATDEVGHQRGYFYSSTGLVDSVVDHSVPVWIDSSGTVVTRNVVTKMTYDAQGNVRTATAPNGVTSTTYADSLGRTILSWDPYNTLTRETYDVMNRAVRQTVYSNAQSNPYVGLPRAGCSTAEFVCGDSTVAWRGGLIPDSLTTQYFNGPVGVDSVWDPRSVKATYRYDAAGRLSQTLDEKNVPSVSYLGVSGLIDSVKSRSSQVVRYRYDSVGRITSTIYPSRFWATRGQSNEIDSVTTPGDSVTDTYDVSGNLLQSKSNRANRGTTTRTYFADGSLKTRVVTYPILDSISYVYDASGALVLKYHVTVEANTVLRDTTFYKYNASAGTLDTIVVKWITPLVRTQRVAFTWDALGRRSSMTYQTGHKITYAYDALGVMRDLRSGDLPCGANNLCYERHNSQVDAIGRILRTNETCYGDESASSYSCSVTPSAQIDDNRYYRIGWLSTQKLGFKTDSLEYDASGNIRRDIQYDDSMAHLLTFGTGSNRVSIDSLHWVGGNSGVRTFAYTSDGDREHEEVSIPSSDSLGDRFYYYDGLGRTSGIENYSEYGLARYQDSCDFGPDGEQAWMCDAVNGVIYEGANPVATSNGIWHFIDGPGVDDPVLAFGVWPNDSGAYANTKLLYFVTDGGGRLYGSADTTGYFDPALDGSSGWAGWKMAGTVTASHSFNATRSNTGDLAGVSFFRNRIYDQRTGMWTQEDPAGMGGGLNLYQYSGNNPVSLSDPFGTSIFSWISGIIGWAAVFVAEVAIPGVGWGAAAIKASEAIGAVAAGSAAAAGVESIVGEEHFSDAFDRDFGISAAVLAGDVGVAEAFGGGVSSAGANSIFQGFVHSRNPIHILKWTIAKNGGGITFGSASLLGGLSNGSSGLEDLATHELGHTFQFIGLSAFGNPWPTYLALAAPGVIWHSNPWERLATFLGGQYPGRSSAWKF
ncbi:MAG TPA: RHS repeat-associated core domain-containing protein [Gemmatimonadales bacterium]|nr:RHS repeat-associated core domain-containing protein [Gemmatimonadales bacterium]